MRNLLWGRSELEAEIKRFKEQNGNASYSVKEIVGGLSIKLDDMRGDIVTNGKEISVLKTWNNAIRGGLGILFIALGYLIFVGVK